MPPLWGGPIVRNKLFFFADYEGFQIRNSDYSQLTVPSPDFRAAAEAAVPAYKKWFDLQPLPNTPPYKPGQVDAVYGVSQAERSNDNYGNLRVDYYPASRWRLILRYTRARPFSSGPYEDLVDYPQIYQGYTEAGSGQVLYTRGNTLYEGRFGINYNDTVRNRGPLPTYTNSIRKFNGIDTGSFEQLFQGGRTLVYEGKVTRQLGHHVLKYGGSYTRSLAQRQDQSAPELEYANVADFLANIPNKVTVTDGVKLFNLTAWSIGTFLQDDWKVNDRLTINAGVRWDYFAPAGDGYNRYFNRGGPYGTGAYLTPGTSWNRNWTDFSPRLGLAYQPGGSGKTVIHAGIGQFYSGHAIYGGPLGSVRDAQNSPNHTKFSRKDVLKYPAILKFPVITENTLPLNNVIDSSLAINPKYPDPYSVQYLFGVEQQLGQNWGLDVKYVGNIARNLILIREINRPDRITGDRPVDGLGTFDYYDAVGSSNYNALQTSLQYRFSHGLQWNVHYTWAHALAHSNAADIISPTELQESFNVNDDYGPADSDIRNRIVSNLIYQPLFSHILGSGCKPWLCDGWLLAAIVEANSGHAINVIQNTGLAGSRPDRVPGVPLYLSNYRTTRQYLNPAAFQAVPLGAVSRLPLHPGSAGRDVANAPGNFNVDLTLGRSIVLYHSVAFRLSATALNAFNHVNYRMSQHSSYLQLGSSTFGQLQDHSNPRSIQLSGVLSF